VAKTNSSFPLRGFSLPSPCRVSRLFFFLQNFWCSRLFYNLSPPHRQTSGKQTSLEPFSTLPTGSFFLVFSPRRSGQVLQQMHYPHEQTSSAPFGKTEIAVGHPSPPFEEPLFPRTPSLPSPNDDPVFLFDRPLYEFPFFS